MAEIRLVNVSKSYSGNPALTCAPIIAAWARRSLMQTAPLPSDP